MASVQVVDPRRRYHETKTGSISPSACWHEAQAGPSQSAYSCALAWIFLGNQRFEFSLTAVIKFQNLTLGYDRLPAVQELDAEVQEGSLTAVVGPNGAGKSTLLKGVTGALSPLDGGILIDGFRRDEIA